MLAVPSGATGAMPSGSGHRARTVALDEGRLRGEVERPALPAHRRLAGERLGLEGHGGAGGVGGSRGRAE